MRDRKAYAELAAVPQYPMAERRWPCPIQGGGDKSESEEGDGRSGCGANGDLQAVLADPRRGKDHHDHRDDREKGPTDDGPAVKWRESTSGRIGLCNLTTGG